MSLTSDLEKIDSFIRYTNQKFYTDLVVKYKKEEKSLNSATYTKKIFEAFGLKLRAKTYSMPIEFCLTLYNALYCIVVICTHH